jgi:hypothetical protein
MAMSRSVQVRTSGCSVGTIMRRPEFAQGLADRRAGKPPDERLVDANGDG